MTIDTMCIYSTAYRYQLRLANLNNKQGKTVTVRNRMTGENTPVTSSQWGLVFNYDEMGDYCAVVLSCDNSAPFQDITDERSMQVSVVQRRGNEVNQLAQTTLGKGISLEDDMNTVCVHLNGYIDIVIDDKRHSIFARHLLEHDSFLIERFIIQFFFTKLQECHTSVKALAHYIIKSTPVQPVTIRYGIQQQRFS